jgi:hypothetical protein
LVVGDELAIDGVGDPVASLRWLGEQPTTQLPSVSTGLSSVCP